MQNNLPFSVALLSFVLFPELQMPQWEETVTDTRVRYEHVFKALADKYPSENLLLVTHGKLHFSLQIHLSCIDCYSLKAHFLNFYFVVNIHLICQFSFKFRRRSWCFSFCIPERCNSIRSRVLCIFGTQKAGFPRKPVIYK